MIEGWTASALVFSGRPDPVWPVGQARAEEILALGQGPVVAPGDQAPDDQAPALGYRGTTLRSAHGELWVFRAGTVTAPDGTVRTDPDRRAELALRDTAPEGVLPPLPDLP